MNIERINNVCNWLITIVNNGAYTTIPMDINNILNVKNELIKISHDIEKEYPFFSNEIFTIKDLLFVYNGVINPIVFGRVIEILRTLIYKNNSKSFELWNLIHPKIISISKKKFEDGHYANAAEDAFIEINDRVKKLFKKVKPNECNIPDGSAVMTRVFSDNNPLIEFCDRSSDTGSNIQKGYMQMLSGAISALRNPKAHANITITKEDAMRQLMFASMLMYKIDEAVAYSKISEN